MRELTEKEKKRAAKVAETRAEMEKAGWKAQEVTLSVVRANVYALLWLIPFAVLFIALFVMMGHRFHWDPEEFASLLLFAAAMMISIFVHEELHGLTWGMFASQHFKSIEFGFIKEMATPYCSCTEPLRRGSYLLGAFMPCLLLGLVPCVAAVFSRQVFMLAFGLIMIGGAGGDLTIMLKMLTFKENKREVLYLDHPTECGFIALTRE